MGVGRVEQVEGPLRFGGKPYWWRPSRSGYRRHLKRRLSRLRRRAFRQYGPDAPTDRRAFLRGWE